MLDSSRDKNEGTYGRGRGEEGPYCYPDMRYLVLGGSARVHSARITCGIKKKTRLK